MQTPPEWGWQNYTFCPCRCRHGFCVSSISFPSLSKKELATPAKYERENMITYQTKDKKYHHCWHKKYLPTFLYFVHLYCGCSLFNSKLSCPCYIFHIPSVYIWTYQLGETSSPPFPNLICLVSVGLLKPL